MQVQLNKEPVVFFFTQAHAHVAVYTYLKFIKYYCRVMLWNSNVLADPWLGTTAQAQEIFSKSKHKTWNLSVI